MKLRRVFFFLCILSILFVPKSFTYFESNASKNCESKEVKVAIVVDVFRAFTTAAYVLDRAPAFYAITTKSSVVAQLAEELELPLLIGKSEVA